MPLDVDRLAEEMLKGAQALIAKAMEPVVADNSALREANDLLRRRLDALEAREPQPGRDGKDADLGEVRALIADALASLPPIPEAPELPDVGALVAEAVAALPAPEDGASVTVADVAPLIAEQVAKAVDALPKPKDGVGLAGAMIDRSGALVVTLTDGSLRELGPVVGKDGERGRDGQDGADGVGFDDLDVAYDGERGITLRFTKGERVVERSFSLPVVIDRGVYAAGKEYFPGDGVTYGGSYWIAQEPTSEMPGSGKGFRLSVKRGRDGKDGVVKAEGSPAPIKVG